MKRMDLIFKALSDETRRTLLDSLRQRDGQTLSELEKQTGLSRFGVMKHLKVLEDASLVVTRRSGRFKHHYLNAVPLQQLADLWIEPMVQKPAARRVLDLKAQLERPEAMNATTNTEQNPDFVLETFIRTTPAKLWDALTKKGEPAKYHFAAADVQSDLTVGGRFDHLTPDGNLMLGGEILAIEPERRLELTFEPGWMGPDAVASRCVYEIEVEGDHCKLTVLHFAIPDGQGGVREGWARVVSALKTYLETGQPARFSSLEPQG